MCTVRMGHSQSYFSLLTYACKLWVLITVLSAPYPFFVRPNSFFLYSALQSFSFLVVACMAQKNERL